MLDDEFRDVLVFLNEKNLLKPPISLTNDRIKSEFTSLRRHKKSIRIGICRCTDQSLFNNTTIRHLGSLTFDEFQKLTLDDSSTLSLNESRKSLTIIDKILTNTESKKILNKNKLLVQKRSTSPNRDSGFIETDGTNTSMVTDRSVISNYHKRRSKSSMDKSEDESMDTHKSLDSLQQSISKITTEQIKNKPSDLIYSTQTLDKHHRIQRDLPTQAVTDACFIYRRQVVKQDTTNDEKSAIINRGREIAHEAANTPTIPPSMPNYTRDQIRELYGDLDKKTRRLQEDEYTLHSPIKNSYSEKPQWKLASPTTKSKIIDECPLPKFRLDKTPENDETLLMAAYLSTGFNNSQTKPIVSVDNFHTVMMNASAKVNEWANNNEIYLSPIEKDIIHTDGTIFSSSPLLIDVHSNLKKLTGTPTGNNDRPTFLEIIEQQTINNSNENFNKRENRRSIRRQQHMTDTSSTSPDSVQIVLETTPSTPGSCGMYLEPYMRHGYDIPSIDHHIRDSSWENIEKSITSTKNITPIESPTTPKFDTNIHPSPSITSQIIDSDNLMDLDDGTTNSYHTAKESRINHGHQSTLSIESDETTSTLHQPVIQDDLVTNIFSSEGSFYYDALASPSQTNQQIISSIDKQNFLIDNLTTLLEEIETFNLTNLNEDKSRLQPEGEESTNNIDQLITIVEDIHQFNPSKTTNTMDNLLFIYDDINDEQPTPFVDNLVEIDPTPSCVNNLLFIYDEIITPTDGESKQIGNDSDEWSYDNLTTKQDEQVNTDYLGTIVHEALEARFQKPIKFKQTNEIEEEDSAVSFEKLINQTDNENLEPIADTDNLGTIIHDVLSARFQQPIKIKTIDQLDPEILAEESQEFIDEPVADTDNLCTIVHESLAARFQQPINIKPIVDFDQQLLTETYEAFIDEPTTDTIDHETLKEVNNELNQESILSNFEKPIDESMDQIHTLETIIYEIESENQQSNFPISESDPPPVSNLSRIVSDSLLTSSKYYRYNQDENKIEFNITHRPPPPPVYDEEVYEEYGYRRTTTDSETDDIVEKFEELCRRYSSNYDQYEKTTKNFDDDINQFEKQLYEQKDQILTPTSDTTSEELITTIERVFDMGDEITIKSNDTNDFYLTLTIKRQPNNIGKYGFNFEEYFDGKIKISSIIDENYCPNLNIGDEIISINNNRTFKTRAQCQLIFDSLWKNFYENIQITILKSGNIPIIPSK